MHALLLFAASLTASHIHQDEIELRVRAGDRTRRDAIVSVELRATLTFDELPALHEKRGEQWHAVPCQLEGTSLVWVADGELPAGSERRYRVTPGRGGAPEVEPCATASRAEGAIDLGAPGRPVARYHEAVVAAPEGVEDVYARSGYLHPLWSPSGRVLTGDFCASHPHQHGVMFAWTRTRFEERPIDFWNAAARQGRVEHVAVEGSGGGHVFAWLRARLRHVDLTAPDGERPALDESWALRAFVLEDVNVLDLVSKQARASESPLVCEEYHYGGLAWRGPEAWEGSSGVTMRTSEGKDRIAGNETRARWVAVTGVVDGEIVTLAVLADPSNFRAPQPVRLHPENPYFCFAPCQLGEFVISDSAHFINRYRYVMSDGELDPERIEELWYDFVQPAEVIAPEQ